MEITYRRATDADIAPIYAFCEKLIQDYEQLETIDYPRVMHWVRNKIERSIDEYTAVFLRDQKIGYYHFYQNDDGEMELDDLYIFPAFQNRGIGSEVVQHCCRSVTEPVMLYVFIANQRAVSLYRRLGFVISETIGSSRYIMRTNPKFNGTHSPE